MEPHWSDPGAYAVAPGVHRIPLPLPMDGLKAVNVYVIETADGLTCVDGGWAIEVSRSLFEESLASLGFHPRDIASFLVTHVHRDHYTQAVALRSEFGRATVSLGLGDKPTLDLIHDDDIDADPTVARLQLIGAHHLAEEWAKWISGSAPDREVWLPPDTWLDGETRIAVGERTIVAVPTPGHTQGHYVYADTGAGLLFAGDHVLPTITPSVGFEPKYADLPLHDYLASLARVRAMPDLRLLPAHGAVTDSTHQRIDELLAHHEHRLDLCLQAIAPTGSTSYDVAAQLPWTRHDKALADLDLFNSGLAAMETMVHLDLLVARRQLVRDDVDWVATYRTPA
jgi:glyoxylase-like metal-dependent hydrolase (beta-lactamase superfamily II)